jgi:hypothetical protein
LAGARRGRGDNCRARGASIGFPATRSTQTLDILMRMRAPFLVATVLALNVPSLGYAEDEVPSCSLVTGELSIWNGWPPPIRIVGPDGVVYGVPEPENDQPLAPEELLTLLRNGKTPVSGSFTLCPLGGTTTVPYDKRPIVLVSILDFDIVSK